MDYVDGSSEGYYVDFSLCWPDEDFGGRGWLGRRDEEEGISGGGPGDDDSKKKSEQQRQLDCDRALAEARQDRSALDRAEQNTDAITQAAQNKGIDLNLLAAIGVRETGFRNIPQTGGGGGRGVFQIDIGYHPNAESFAFDIPQAANYAAGLVAQSYNRYSRQGFDPGLSLAGAIRDYNASARRTPFFLRTGWPGYLDIGTAHGNYVSNVLAIAANCFSF